LLINIKLIFKNIYKNNNEQKLEITNYKK